MKLPIDSPEDENTVPLTRSTPENRREDVDSVLKTGCEAANKDKFDTPADDLKVLDQFFPRSSRPKARGQSHGLWGCPQLDEQQQDISPMEFAEQSIPVDVICSRRERKNDIADALNWLHKAAS